MAFFIDLDYLPDEYKKLSKEEQKILNPVFLTIQSPNGKLTAKQRKEGWYYELTRPYRRKDMLIGYKKEEI